MNVTASSVIYKLVNRGESTSCHRNRAQTMSILQHLPLSGLFSWKISGCSGSSGSATIQSTMETFLPGVDLYWKRQTNESQVRLQQGFTFECKSYAHTWLSLDWQIHFWHPSTTAYECVFFGLRANVMLTCFLSVPLKDFAPKYRRVDPESITQYLVHEESWMTKTKPIRKISTYLQRFRNLFTSKSKCYQS